MTHLFELLEDWKENLSVMQTAFDLRMLREILLAPSSIFAFFVFPSAYFFGKQQNGIIFYPVIVFLQIGALLSLDEIQPKIYGGSAFGYYCMIVTGHLITILVMLLLSLGAYFTMHCLRRDYIFERILLFLCAIVLLSKVLYYAR